MKKADLSPCPVQRPSSRKAGLAFAVVVIAGCLSAPVRVAAQDSFATPAVIELFTSQGCSSCPAADKLLEKLARKPNVIALSFSVDYWDYIGWKDTFASPAFSARQRAYAASRRDSHVYTPQAIIDGMQHAVGSDLAAISRAANLHHGGNGVLKVAMRTRVQDGRVICNVGDGIASAPAKANLWLFRILAERDVQIGRGENRGRKITYVNIVRSMQKVGEWHGKAAQFEISAADLKKDSAEGWVLMLQAGSEARPGAILAAAKAKGF